jgi:hypothetical protein
MLTHRFVRLFFFAFVVISVFLLATTAGSAQKISVIGRHLASPPGQQIVRPINR